MAFPTSLDSFTTVVDNVTSVLATHVNEKNTPISTLQAKVGVDSSGVTTSIDYFLKNAGGTFKTHVHSGADAAKVSLSNLADVTITSIADAQILRYESSSGKWKNVTSTSTFAGLTDVTIAAPALRESIYYDTGDSKWKNGYANATYAA